MKRLISAGLLLTLLCSNAYARTMYVSDVIKLSMRRGASFKHKVIAEPQSGQKLDALGTDGEWTHIRLPDGKEGWVLTRFLITRRPYEHELKALREKHEKLSSRLASVTAENGRLKEENERLRQQSDRSREDLEALTRSYETLKTESQDYLNVKAAYEKAAFRLKEQQQRADRLALQVSELSWKRDVMYALTGAGILLFGYLMGRLKRKQRRSSFLS